MAREEKLTISVFTENRPGLLHRVTVAFTRRKLNIEGITVGETETDGLYRYTITLSCSRCAADKVVQHLEKQVEVVKAFVHSVAEVVQQEIALYKVSTSCLAEGIRVEELVRGAGARVLTLEPDYMVFEKTGLPEETSAFYERLAPYGILEFVRSGPVAITRPMKTLRAHIADLEASHEKYRGGARWHA